MIYKRDIPKNPEIKLACLRVAQKVDGYYLQIKIIGKWYILKTTAFPWGYIISCPYAHILRYS